jgi:hypothetical protein
MIFLLLLLLPLLGLLTERVVRQRYARVKCGEVSLRCSELIASRALSIRREGKLLLRLCRRQDAEEGGVESSVWGRQDPVDPGRRRSRLGQRSIQRGLLRHCRHGHPQSLLRALLLVLLLVVVLLCLLRFID